MDTNDIKQIWKTLADKNIIEKELARENIFAMLNKKGAGLMFRMKKKVLFDYILYLSTSILIPLAIIFVNFILKRPSPPLQIVGVFAIECYLLFMFLKAKRRLNSLGSINVKGTIKESMVEFRDKYLRNINMEKWVVLIFAEFIISLALVQMYLYRGRILPIELSEPYSFFTIFLPIMLFAVPFIVKLEYRIRFSKIIEDINNTIEELNSNV